MRFATLALMVLAACVPPATPGGASQGASSAGLLGREWRLTDLEGKPSVRTRGERQPHLRFLADGKLEGFGSCNGFSGTYEATGSTLRVGSLMSTKMACADAQLNRQESRFLGVLESARNYTIAGDVLTLRSADAELATFQAASK